MMYFLTHLKFCLATFKCTKITHICLILDQLFANIDVQFTESLVVAKLRDAGHTSEAVQTLILFPITVD